MKKSQLIGNCVALLSLGAFVGSCGGSSDSITGPPPPPPVASVSVELQSAKLIIGSTTQATAQMKDAAGNVLTGRGVTWASTNIAVTTVNPSGVVTAVSEGSTSITATSEGQTGLAAIMVTPIPVASVTLTLAASSITVGANTQATATTKDANGNVLTGRAVTWASSNTAIATVSTSGLVTALAAGNSNITATSEGQTGSATITVIPIPVASVSVTLAASSIIVGGTTQANATTKDANGNVLTGRAVTWASSNTAIATVSTSGLVTALAAGNANITATSESQSGSATVTVTPIPVASVSVTLAASSITVGANTQATATTKDANGNVLTGRAVTWASSNTAIATVSTSGLVTAVAAGNANITATSEAQSGSAAITVTLQPVASVSVTGRTALVVADTTTLVATPLSSSGQPLAGRLVTWSSGTPTVATVSASGLVTAVAAGTANIIATSEGQSGSATITVTPQPVASLSVTGKTALVVGDTTTLVATPRNASGQPLSGRVITWSSGTPTVATVSANGLVTAIAAGSAVITATTEGWFATLTVNVSAAPPTTGIAVSVNSPVATNEFIFAVDGGGFGTTPQVSHITGTSMTSGSVTLGVPAGGPYRVRVIAVDPRTSGTFPLMNATGKVEGVTVTAGALSTAAVTLAQPTINITAPASVTPGQAVSITWTVTDPGASIDRPTLDGRVLYNTSSFSDLSGTQIIGTGTKVSPTSYQFTASFTAPTITGTLYYQTAAQTFDLSIPGTSRAGWLIQPSSARGEPLGQIAVTAPTTGIAVSVSSLVATNEFIVAVDGAGFGTTPQVSHITGTSMTSGSVTLGILAGGPYRVRVVAVDPRSSNGTFPLMNATGKVDGVTVTAGTLSPAAVTLAQPTINITAPASVTPGQAFSVTWTVTDPGASIDRPSLDGRVLYNTSSFSDLAGTQINGTGTKVSATSYQFTASFTAPTTTGTLYYQTAAQTFDLSIPGTSRAGWLIQPSSARSEPLGQITVAAPPDTIPPTFAGLIIAPDTVDNGAADATVRLSVHWTKATGSGVIAVQALVNPPVGYWRQCTSTTVLISGTPNDGVWACDVVIPKGTATGIWHIGWVLATDGKQNSRTVTEAELQTAGYRTTILVTSSVPPDTVPPTFAGLTIAPDTVDNGTAGATVRLSMRWTKTTGSGVIAVQALVNPPVGGWRQCTSTTLLISGTPNDGLWACDVVIPQGTATGLWHIGWVMATDGKQNSRTVTEAELQTAGYRTTILVTSSVPPDTVPPTLAGLTIAPDTVGNGAANATVRLSMHWTKTIGSGVIAVQALVNPPVGGWRQCTSTTLLISGTPNDGVWACDVVIPQGTATGLWHIGWVMATDALQNSRTVTEALLQTAGYLTTILVTP